MPDTHTFLLIDASGLLYRSFFALPPLTTPSGAPSGALFGFIRSILKVIHKVEPSAIVAVFDGPHNKKARLELFPEYKAHRKPTPDELLIQIQEARKFCALWGIPEVAVSGVEADDSIASIVVLAKREHFSRIFICTADKDLAQLVDETVHIINPAKDDAVIGPKQAEEQYGLPPSQLADFLALVGDSSDNIPGVDGIGPKTAIELIKTYGSLEGVLENASKIAGKKGERLVNGSENARLSRKLVELDMNVSVPQEKSFYQLKAYDAAQVQNYFLQMGFKTLLQLLPHPHVQREPSSSDCTIIKTREEFENLLSKLTKTSEIVLSVQYSEDSPSFIGLGVAINAQKVWYIHCEKDLEPNYAVSALLTHLSEHSVQLCGHDLKSILHILLKFGSAIPTLAFDTQLADWLIAPNEKSHDLGDLSVRVLLQEKSSIEAVTGKGKKAQPLSLLSAETIAQFVADDLRCIIALKEKLSLLLREAGLEELLQTFEMPLIPILLKMELTGVYVDTQCLYRLQNRVEGQLQELAHEIHALAGKEFNINSPKQLSEVLFVDLHLPTSGRGKQQLSTNVDVLEELAKVHPIAQKLLEYRMLDKLQSTYIEAILQLLKKDRRVHCTFLQTGTSTGRIACQSPNLQNIPIKTDLGKEIREAFKPERENCVFISSDYSQIELRILAHMSRDPSLLQAFADDTDIHAMTASKVFHVPLNEVTEAQRRKAKAVNFGLLYGQQAFGLSAELKITPKEAQEIINDYFAQYSSVRAVLEEVKAKARLLGYAETLTGRRRPLPEMHSNDFFTRAAAERLAVNTPFQGTGADIIKKAMINLDRAFQAQKITTKMILQIHDELLFEAPEDEIDRVVQLIRIHMEGAMKLLVPLKVEISVGKNWKEC